MWMMSAHSAFYLQSARGEGQRPWTSELKGDLGLDSLLLEWTGRAKLEVSRPEFHETWRSIFLSQQSNVSSSMILINMGSIKPKQLISSVWILYVVINNCIIY